MQLEKTLHMVTNSTKQQETRRTKHSDNMKQAHCALQWAKLIAVQESTWNFCYDHSNETGLSSKMQN
jgi:hypothetical protein